MANSSTNRRTFIKASVGAAAAAALTGSTSTTQAQEKQTVADQMPIMVNHEWGKLKEVVVGVPNVRLPTRLAEAAFYLR